MDNDPKPDVKTSQVITDYLQSESFKIRLAKINKELAASKHNAPKLERLSLHHEQKLIEVFDNLGLYSEASTVISGLMHLSDSKDELTGEREYKTGLEVLYIGPSVRVIDGVPQMTLNFTYVTGESYEDDPIEEYMYVNPLDIADFEVFEKREEDKTIEDFLHEFSDESRTLTSDPQFLRLPFSEQKQVLDSLTNRIHNKISEYFDDKTWAVETFMFMSEYSDLPVALRDTIVDQDNTPSSELYIPIGKYTGCLFAELHPMHMPPLNAIRTQNGLSLGNGVPCIVFESETTEVTTKYLVPIDKVVDTYPVR